MENVHLLCVHYCPLIAHYFHLPNLIFYYYRDSKIFAYQFFVFSLFRVSVNSCSRHEQSRCSRMKLVAFFCKNYFFLKFFRSL